ncbi:MAG: 4-hydroxythreonine-4-phosphate dehydrogenase PdxA, partial [Desulfobacula sp.]|nr:4-hydroxythreonine-4-phosphate dehydrogenase PdxA [Desulfobacula sp.]
DIKTGKAMLNYILKGIDLALENRIQALVTCPITKTALKLAGSQFPGHTEILAHKTNTKNYAMMLAGDRLKVVLVTIHIPLSKVAASFTTKSIIQKIELTHTSLKERFDIKSPRIAVAGLNPHAGEALMFGNEEEKIISPAVKLANQKGYMVEGPLPPDTVFYQAVHGKSGDGTNRGKYDAVICMYHDQGLIPFKLIHFKDGVNTTLGLPIVRTSVDHGTAYDIAWQGIADHSSLVEAIKMAIFQANNLHGM